MQDAGEAYTRWIGVERLGREPIVFDIVASGSEIANLVQRLDVVEISGLKASGSLSRLSDQNMIELTGSVEAEVTQSCVVSLEPVIQKIEENFTVCYTFDKEQVAIEDVDYVVKLEERDLPELIEGGRIDVVHAIAEQITLALEPYPRAEEAENTEVAKALRKVEAEAQAEEREPEVHKPFANLKDLMNKK